MRLTLPHEIDALQENYIRNGGSASRFRDIKINAQFQCLHNPYLTLADVICDLLKVREGE